MRELASKPGKQIRNEEDTDFYLWPPHIHMTRHTASHKEITKVGGPYHRTAAETSLETNAQRLAQKEDEQPARAGVFLCMKDLAGLRALLPAFQRVGVSEATLSSTLGPE